VGRLASLLALVVLASACGGGGDKAAPPEPPPAPPATTATDETTTTSAPPPAAAPARLRLEEVASGLDNPVHVAAAPGELERLFVVEQGGTIRVVERGRVRPEPFLDIRELVRAGGEQGLLSVAFHPDYGENRRLYVNFTNTDGDTRVVEYRTGEDRADPGTARELLAIDQPYPNHNGGQLAFGPDGLLYVGMGDGGGGGDPENRAQDLEDRLGKLLRIDVDDADAEWETAAYGLRNPWRFSFDRADGDLLLADVGQSAQEEVNQLAWPADELVNFGWDVFEGRARYEDKEPNSEGRLVAPKVVYGRDAGCSVTGGFVYRGEAIPAAQGRYFFGDYCSGIVWSVVLDGPRARGLRRERFTVEGLTSFGEDLGGELYLVSQGGTLFRLAA
jgi:glucose/arabinose dehydrogenase